MPSSVPALCGATMESSCTSSIFPRRFSRRRFHTVLFAPCLPAIHSNPTARSRTRHHNSLLLTFQDAPYLAHTAKFVARLWIGAGIASGHRLHRARPGGAQKLECRATFARGRGLRQSKNCNRHELQ